MPLAPLQDGGYNDDPLWAGNLHGQSYDDLGTDAALTGTLVTATLSCAATNAVSLATLKLNARTFSITATGVITLKRDTIKKLNVTVIAVPRKLIIIARAMTTLVSITVPRVLRQPQRTLTLTGLAAPVVRLIRFGASAWDEIDAHRKWGITNAAKWSIKQVQRFQFSSAMKGR